MEHSKTSRVLDAFILSENLQEQIARLEAVAMETVSNTPEKQDMRLAFEKSTRMIQDPDYYADVLSSQTWGGGRS